MKAASVPALASDAISDSGMTPAITAAMTPVRMVTRLGTPRGDTAASHRGSRPSRL